MKDNGVLYLEKMAERHITSANYITSVNGMVHPDRVLPEHDFLYMLDGTWEAVSYTHLDVYKRQGAPEPVCAEDTGEHGYVLGEVQRKKVHISFVEMEGRRYLEKTVEVTESDNPYSLQEKISSVVARDGAQNMYRITLTGAVSYTHLDVYKRQLQSRSIQWSCWRG